MPFSVICTYDGDIGWKLAFVDLGFYLSRVLRILITDIFWITCNNGFTKCIYKYLCPWSGGWCLPFYQYGVCSTVCVSCFGSYVRTYSDVLAACMDGPKLPVCRTSKRS